MRRFAPVLLVVFLAMGCTGDDDARPVRTVAPIDRDDSTTVTVEPVEPTTTEAPADTDGTPAEGGFTEPRLVEAPPPDRIEVPVASWELVADPGTEWEMPLLVGVPMGWTWDAGHPGFTNGAASMVFETDCSDGCRITDWGSELQRPGGFFDRAADRLPSGGYDGAGGFSGSSPGRAAQSRRSQLDDGTGVSLTARTHPAAGRFLGCTATSVAGGVELDVLEELCQQVDIDWAVVLASTPDEQRLRLLTDAAAAQLADPVPGVPRIEVELDDGDRLAEIALPADGETRDSFFGVELVLADTSIFTEITIDTGCDGTCEPKDWAAILNEPGAFPSGARLSIEPENDSPIEAGWLLSGERLDGRGHRVLVMRWDDRADRYLACDADVDAADRERIDDIIGLCLAVRPSWFSW